jgi:hypothetical protein
VVDNNGMEVANEVSGCRLAVPHLADTFRVAAGRPQNQLASNDTNDTEVLGSSRVTSIVPDSYLAGGTI